MENINMNNLIDGLKKQMEGIDWTEVLRTAQENAKNSPKVKALEKEIKTAKIINAMFEGWYK